MEDRLSPGAVGVRKSEPGVSLVVVEPHGSRWVVARRGAIEPMEIEPGEVEVIGRDDASARVLGLRWRSAAQASVFPPARPVRTAMVLCAGLGTRLRPLTNLFPKPALPFFDGPLIRYSLALLHGAGVSRVVINTHHLPEVMEQAAGQEAQALGLELLVSHEPVIQGTGGGVRDARRLLGDEPFILLNGDAFMSVDLRALLGAHQARGDAATMAVVPMPPDEMFGAVEADAGGVVRRIAGVGDAGPAPLIAWHFIGAHVIEPSIFDFIPAAGEQDINRTVYLAMVRAGLAVRACPVALGAWADLGTPHRYLRACEEILTGLCDLAPMSQWGPVPAAQLQSLRQGSPRCWVHPTARVQSSSMEDVVVCARAQVDSLTVTRAAVLPDTRVDGTEELRGVIACGELRLGTS
jgi:mannose-1-phosphate guanylyltransferase